ncbi:MAG: putative sporulation protein YtxC, partial [Tissierellia bacterium]|nr:putative sporulation protein YtxC [Tissierellia bacterium]
LVLKDGDYELYDEVNDIIDKDFFNEVIKEIGSENISKDDLLISTLIVIAPRRLRIHLNQRDRNNDLTKIIVRVFQDRVYFCYGCNKCNKHTRIKGY